MAECSEVALFEKTFVIFTIKSMMYLRRFRLSLEETKAYFDCVNCSCRNKMPYELARWTHDDVRVIRSRSFLQFPIYGPALCYQHFLCFIFRNRSIQMTIVHVSKACGWGRVSEWRRWLGGGGGGGAAPIFF